MTLFLRERKRGDVMKQKTKEGGRGGRKEGDIITTVIEKERREKEENMFLLHIIIM